MRKSTTMNIETASDIVILGNECEEQDDTGLAWRAPEAYIRGTVHITLTKPKTLKTLQVELICRQTVVIDGMTSAYGIRQATAILSSGPRMLEAGSYSFPFQLVVPNESAPSDRTPYGRTLYKLIASAAGLGKIGTCMTADREITLIATHGDCGGLPPGHSLKTETFSQNLGPIAADLSSSYLLVGGMLNFGLEMPSILRPIQLEDVRIEIAQKYEMRALDEKWRHEKSKGDTFTVWSMRTEERLGFIRPGGCCTVQRQLRMPIEGKLRPSTPDASITGLRVSHRIEIIIVYTPLEDNPQKQKKEFRIGSAATISSCHCTLDALQLPAYQQHDTPTAESGAKCMCLATTAERQRVYGLHEPVSLDLDQQPDKSDNSQRRFERIDSMEVAYM